MTLPADAPVYATPSGVLLGTLKKGSTVRPGKTNGAGWTSVVIEGWIVSSRVATRNDTLDRSVTGRGSAQVRAAASAAQSVVADVELGTALKRLGERNGWTQVRRTAWIRSSALPAGKTPVTPPPQRPPARQAAASPPSNDASDTGAATQQGGAQRTVRTTTLRDAPGGAQRASVSPGTTVQTLARENGWARVRIEGWVPERDLVMADSTQATLSAADLRSDPAAYRGKVVRWEVQVVSMQRADVLRKGMTPDESFLIARGPGAEAAILYIVVPPALMEQARAVPQLSNALVTARVREGRSEPVGVPILELISLTKLP